MAENKIFQFALLVSILLHFVIFIGLPRMPFMPSPRSLQTVKITYYDIREEPKKKMSAKKTEPIVKKLPDVTKKEILEPPKTAEKKAENLKPRPVPRKTASIEDAKEKTFAKVIEEERDISKKATYISYYKAVRERIREWADENYPKNKRLAQGEVFLSFIVASSGELLQVRVVDEKSSSIPFLRNIAINSIRDASPFPAFPEGMSQYQITFNVIISFEAP
ncbi:MAG: TonB family protein [Candidatus Omnitrophica bacterium]|nr:TonB family protein [Candidatus Omnitrophota bacterium]